MSFRTDNFNLLALDPGDSLNAGGYGFMRDNILKIDRLLAAATSHDHTDTGTALADPTVAPTLVLTSGVDGELPAGTTVRYRYAWVDQNGSETAASPESTVATPAVVQKPAGPGVTSASTGGTLLGGLYNYILSAYVTTNTNETDVGTRQSISVPFTTATNAITLTMPTLPTGATGFNIYRRAPGEAYFAYLASETGASYVDTGGTTPTYSRQPQVKNLTNKTNKVNIELPVALPANATWKIYRTFVSGNWNASSLKHVTEETFVGSGIIVDNFDDLGFGTGLESAPEVTQIAAVPSQIANNEVNFTWTPHTVGYTNFTLGDGTDTARYCQLGKVVHYRGETTLGSTSSVTGNIRIDLPVPMSNDCATVGTAYYREAGVSFHVGVLHVATDQTTTFLTADPSNQADAVDDLEPFTWGNGDVLAWNITYEAA